MQEKKPMLTYVIAYVIALFLFAAIDIAWLTTAGAALYRATLGDILLQSPRMGPAAAFYLLYPAGIVLFAIAPSLKSGSTTNALVYGALFGFFTYATYDLTNHATLKAWETKLTVVDVVYGAVAVGVVSLVTFLIMQWLGRTAA
jgi:uncharacterized membrane protein